MPSEGSADETVSGEEGESESDEGRVESDAEGSVDVEGSGTADDCDCEGEDNGGFLTTSASLGF